MALRLAIGSIRWIRYVAEPVGVPENGSLTVSSSAEVEYPATFICRISPSVVPEVHSTQPRMPLVSSVRSARLVSETTVVELPDESEVRER
jgi:hypothetical protein